MADVFFSVSSALAAAYGNRPQLPVDVAGEVKVMFNDIEYTVVTGRNGKLCLSKESWQALRSEMSQNAAWDMEDRIVAAATTQGLKPATVLCENYFPSDVWEIVSYREYSPELEKIQSDDDWGLHEGEGSSLSIRWGTKGRVIGMGLEIDIADGEYPVVVVDKGLNNALYLIKDGEVSPAGKACTGVVRRGIMTTEPSPRNGKERFFHGKSYGQPGDWFLT